MADSRLFPLFIALVSLYLSPSLHAASAVVLRATPAAAGATDPSLTKDRSGKIILSWIETEGPKSHAFKFATCQSGKWSSPHTIVSTEKMFANWADIPAVAVDAKGVMFAHWLEMRGSGYAYDIRVSSSSDGGTSWRRPIVLHDDGKRVEHGFVSMTALPQGGVGALWLDGRNMKEDAEEGEMSLRYAEVDAQLKIHAPAQLDTRVCDCCSTGMTMTPRGMIAVYRDRSPDEVRDISVVRQMGKGWTPPATLHADRWKISGCPVNGPQIDARGERVVAAWFTAPYDQAKVNVAFSADAGAKFGAPIRADLGSPAGRVEVVQLSDGSAMLLWIEKVGLQSSVVARRMRPDGKNGVVVTLGAVSGSRSSGFPRAVESGGIVYVAWTDDLRKDIRLAELAVDR